MEYTGVDVVIPAHDEQDLLAGCLDALEDCIAATPVPVTVTVVLDSCRDATEKIARGRERSRFGLGSATGGQLPDFAQSQ